MADPDDLFEKAGGLFKKLGSTLKSTSKQVTGLGRGKVRLELDRTRIAPGDVMRGRIVLELSEPVDAKRLIVTLRAHQRSVSYDRSGSGPRTPTTSLSEIFHFDHEVAGLKSYAAGTLPFELTVPPDALDKHAPPSHPIADAVRSVAAVFQPSAGPIEWSVTARLDVPWGRDLTASVDIAVAK